MPLVHLKRKSDLPAREIAEEALHVAAELCIYTNDTLNHRRNKNLMDDQHLTPSVIKKELDRYVIGQDEAKAVAIALRNRWRRLNIKNENLRDDIIPKNILMIGLQVVVKLR